MFWYNFIQTGLVSSLYCFFSSDSQVFLFCFTILHWKYIASINLKEPKKKKKNIPHSWTTKLNSHMLYPGEQILLFMKSLASCGLPGETLVIVWNSGTQATSWVTPWPTDPGNMTAESTHLDQGRRCNSECTTNTQFADPSAASSHACASPLPHTQTAMARQTFHLSMEPAPYCSRGITQRRVRPLLSCPPEEGHSWTLVPWSYSACPQRLRGPLCPMTSSSEGVLPSHS